MSAAVEKPQGPGALLEAARRRQGLHIAALAAQLKVSPARLEALEAERWDELPDPTHARALATSVCRVLGVDAAAVLAGMPRAAGAGLERVNVGLNEPVRDHQGFRGASLRTGLPIALLLMLAALAFAFWPPAADELPAPLSTAHELPAEPIPASAAVAAASQLPAVLAASAGAASPPAVVATSSIGPSAAAVGAAAGQGLELRATQGASWVSVVDAAGNNLVSRLLQQGESLSLPATGAPLRLVLGNAPALELSWRGQPQSLEGYEQRRVARLELK
ncbi:MAG: helix-turn-helix domain-containing protein [Inhella sp.]